MSREPRIDRVLLAVGAFAAAIVLGLVWRDAAWLARERPVFLAAVCAASTGYLLCATLGSLRLAALVASAGVGAAVWLQLAYLVWG